FRWSLHHVTHVPADRSRMRTAMSCRIRTSATPPSFLNSSLFVRLLGLFWLCSLLAPLAASAAPAWLSKTERAWLKAHPEIRLARTPEFTHTEVVDNDRASPPLAPGCAADMEQELGKPSNIIPHNARAAGLERGQHGQPNPL